MLIFSQSLMEVEFFHLGQKHERKLVTKDNMNINGCPRFIGSLCTIPQNTEYPSSSSPWGDISAFVLLW